MMAPDPSSALRRRHVRHNADRLSMPMKSTKKGRKTPNSHHSLKRKQFVQRSRESHMNPQWDGLEFLGVHDSVITVPAVSSYHEVLIDDIDISSVDLEVASYFHTDEEEYSNDGWAIEFDDFSSENESPCSSPDSFCGSPPELIAACNGFAPMWYAEENRNGAPRVDHHTPKRTPINFNFVPNAKANLACKRTDEGTPSIKVVGKGASAKVASTNVKPDSKKTSACSSACPSVNSAAKGNNTYNGLSSRAAHNAMERDRRIGLRGSYETLRQHIPNLAISSKASSLQILQEAAAYAVQLAKEEKLLREGVAALRRTQANLRAQRTGLG